MCTVNLREKYQDKLLIAGPCSGESYAQLEHIFAYMHDREIPLRFVRVGVWKPRSRPGTFEGIGEPCLEWIADLSPRYGVDAIIEVSDTIQLETMLQHGIRAFWIGARSAANPFLVQSLADAIRGEKGLSVFVKNSIHPDLSLWMGNLERIAQAHEGLTGAIHRGFSVYQSQDKYRNRPNWAIPLELKRLHPDIPLICDPSHIAGRRDYIYDLGQKAWDMNFDGLMVETHPDPSNAFSDAQQQLNLDTYLQYLQDWKVYASTQGLSDDEQLRHTRENIDAIDAEIIELLANRVQICEDIGRIKNQLSMPAYIPERWDFVLRSRSEQAEKLGLSAELVQMMYQQIHQMSIKAQQKHLKDTN